MRRGISSAIISAALIGLPVAARADTNFLAAGDQGDGPASPAADNPTAAAPAVPHRVYNRTGHRTAPVAASGGKWETVTDQNGHYELILQTAGTGFDPIGRYSIPMQVGGSFTNTDGAHDYDGTISGVVQANSRQLVYGFSQKNGQGGSGSFTLSDDGNSLTGEGVENGTRFTWNGQRAP